MIEAVRVGALSLEKLEAMSAVCSVGLDMVAVPGDTSAETLAAIIADEIAIGVVNNKTTAVRIIPVPGKSAGDSVVYGGLLGEADHAAREPLPLRRVHHAGRAHSGAVAGVAQLRGGVVVDGTASRILSADLSPGFAARTLRGRRVAGVERRRRAQLPAAVLAALPEEERRHVEALPEAATRELGRRAHRAARGAGGSRRRRGGPDPEHAARRAACCAAGGARGSISHKERSRGGAGGARGRMRRRGRVAAWASTSSASRPAGSTSRSACCAPRSWRACRPPEDPRRIEELAFAFSAKEAIYKALDPFVAPLRLVPGGRRRPALRRDGVRSIGSPRRK